MDKMEKKNFSVLNAFVNILTILHAKEENGLWVKYQMIP